MVKGDEGDSAKPGRVLLSAFAEYAPSIRPSFTSREFCG